MLARLPRKWKTPGRVAAPGTTGISRRTERSRRPTSKWRRGVRRDCVGGNRGRHAGDAGAASTRRMSGDAQVQEIRPAEEFGRLQAGINARTEPLHLMLDYHPQLRAASDRASPNHGEVGNASKRKP